MMHEPHEHRPSYWRHQFHHDKTDPNNRSGKHTLVCKHCGEKICPRQRITLPWWMLILAALLLLLMYANEDYIHEHLFLLILPVALVFLMDFYEFRHRTYMLLEDWETQQEAEEPEEEE